MAGKKTQEGPTGKAVRNNIKRLREEQNLKFAELSRRLEDLGNPIPPLGLRRIEQGDRKVDVDDLMAIAAVLGVAPAHLLLPDVAEAAALVDATGYSDITARQLRNWIRDGWTPVERIDLTTRVRSEPPWALSEDSLESELQHERTMEWFKNLGRPGDDDPR